MCALSPTSKTRVVPLLAKADAAWALVAPALALALRQPGLIDFGSGWSRGTCAYVGVSVACSLLAILLFRLGDSLTEFFCERDLGSIAAAAGLSSSLSAGATFTLDRMSAIPRSTPLILAVVLFVGFCLFRLLAVAAASRGRRSRARAGEGARRILLVGVDRFSSQAIRLIEAQTPRALQIAAILDDDGKRIGRTIHGVKVVARPEDLETVVEEYVVHGVEIDGVWLAGGLKRETAARVRGQCAARGLECRTVAAALNLEPGEAETGAQAPPTQIGAPRLYLALKRTLDVAVAAALLIALAPVGCAIAALVCLDVGTPALFWQERWGRGGRRFLLYKFRTYRAPFDARGRAVPPALRLSRLGRAIRATRLDEIPQLVNVLRGDMSLIGPRPLLPADQPADPRTRLSVRPGLTGWAQVNGGVLLTPDEKDALDIWYIRHASARLDLVIAWRTACYFLHGERRNRYAVNQAIGWRRGAAGPAPAASLKPAYGRPLAGATDMLDEALGAGAD